MEHPIFEREDLLRVRSRPKSFKHTDCVSDCFSTDSTGFANVDDFKYEKLSEASFFELWAPYYGSIVWRLIVETRCDGQKNNNE